jgi:hypothetical protein
MTFVPTDGRIDPSWAAWYFGSEPGLEQIRKASPGSAGRNKTLAVKRFEDLVIPLPPIDEQRRQASFLDTASEHARAVAAALTEQGRDAVVATLPPLVDAVVRQYASGRATVGEVVDLVSDIIHPGDGLGDADSFVGLQHIERHTGLRVGSDAVDSMKGRKFRFAPGDLVYGYLRPYLNKVWVADRHGLCSVDQYVLRPRPTTPPELLAHLLRGQAVLDRAIELTHSLQLPRLRSGLLMSLEVPMIAESEAEDVTRRIDGVRDRIVRIAASRQKQLRAAEALVPAALNGAFGSR